MKQSQKKINFYRLSLQRGMLYRMELSEEDCLVGNGGGYFAYITPTFNTLDLDSTFHRLKLEGQFHNCKYEVVAATSNVDLSEMLKSYEQSPMEQLELLKQHCYVRKVNTDDFLLHKLEGKYLWIYISVTSSYIDSNFVIQGVQVEFPKTSFSSYLPEIYEGNEFFDRYMAALQSLYEDLEEEVDKLPLYLDYETTRDENIMMFADWVGIENVGFRFQPDQVRYLITKLQELQSGKGTKEIMQQLLRLLIGREPIIIEYFKWHDWMSGRSSLEEEYHMLYGQQESVFTVLFNFVDVPIEKMPNSNNMMQLIENYMPLGMKCNLVYLSQSYNTDTHCYLEVNSCLSTPTEANMRGFVLGGNYVLG